jgi:hypothetical protein
LEHKPFAPKASWLANIVSIQFAHRDFLGTKFLWREILSVFVAGVSPRQNREFQCDFFLFHGLPSSPLSLGLSPPPAVALPFDSPTKEILGSRSLTTSSFQVAAASSCPSVTDYTGFPTHL